MSEKWWDMSDDELDDLFREASDKAEFPFDSSAYNKLKQKIAAQPVAEPIVGFRKRRLLLLAGLFLVVGVGLMYRFGSTLKEHNSTEISKNIKRKNDVKPQNGYPSQLPKDKQPKILSLNTQTITKTSKNLRGLPTNTNQTQNQHTEGNNLEQSSVKEEAGNLFPQAVITTPDKFVMEESRENTSEPVSDDLKSTENHFIRSNKLKNRIRRKNKNNVSDAPISEQNSSLITEKYGEINPESITEENVTNRPDFYNIDELKNKDSKLVFTEIHTTLPNYVDSLPRITKPIKFSKLGLRFVFSPDFNAIENMGKMALGQSIGLLFEFKINKKLVIQTGMVYSDKNYVGSFDDYHNWKEWRGYHPTKPINVDGGCKIFDLPINLRLNLFQKPKQTWFISSGVSSYLMMNENYTYNYEWTSSRTVDWSDNSTYYFSVLNFSVGLERQISNRFSLQIEPYLKTPLKNVGRGGVSLYSSGVLFSTKYDF